MRLTHSFRWLTDTLDVQRESVSSFLRMCLRMVALFIQASAVEASQTDVYSIFTVLEMQGNALPSVTKS